MSGSTAKDRPLTVRVLRETGQEQQVGSAGSSAGKTIRIRGIPQHWDLDGLHSFLQAQEDAACAVVKSLAPEIHGRFLTATITLQGSPNALPDPQPGRSRYISLPVSNYGGRPQSLTFDVDFFGVTTLFAPPDNDHQIDIVAVPGLGGHAFGSFKERGGEHMWLRDALPYDLTDGDHKKVARVMIYGYESTVAGSINAQNLEDLATSLHSSLLPLVARPGSRPIVFIAHSLGGLIVKQTLMLLADSKKEEHQKLLQAVYGVVFFGVPHAGMSNESIIAMVGDGLNLSLVDSINSINSQILSIQRREFRRALGPEGQTEVFCFYETRASPTARKDESGKWTMTGPTTMLVAKLSATHYGQREDGAEHTCAINRDHSNMVKFGIHDNEYDKVRETLFWLTQRAMTRRPRGQMCAEPAHLAEMTGRYEQLNSPDGAATIHGRPDEQAQVIFSEKRKPIYHIPFSRNKRFVGREEEFRHLERFLFTEEADCVALVGLGGIGKTQIALNLAHWVKANMRGWSVIWLPAFNMAGFEQACTELAMKLSGGRPSNEDPKKLVQRYLNSEDTGNWLLVIDNADDMAVMYGSSGDQSGIDAFLPQHDRGRILLTTRSQEIAVAVAGNNILRLQQLTSNDAMGFLQKSLIQTNQLHDGEAINELLSILGSLPLAIAQAVAYMNINQISIADYLRLCKTTQRDMTELMQMGIRDSTHHDPSQSAVATTWLISVAQIHKTNYSASSLLSFITWIEPKAIPRSMLPELGSEQNKTQAIGTLCGYGFLTARAEPDMFDMHSLVHLVMQTWTQEQGSREEAKGEMLTRLVEIFPSDDWENRELWRRYLPHALRVYWNYKNIDIPMSSKLGYWIGRCLITDGRIRESIIIYEDVVAVAETVLAEDHPNRLASQNMLAGVYLANGQVKEAIELLQHVVAIEEALAEDHPDRLASQHMLAGAYLANGQVKEAIELLQHVVMIREALAEDHPNRLASQHELAGAYLANGQVKEAIELLQHVVMIREALAEDHPDRLASQHELAGAYLANGQVKEAIELLQHIIAIEETVLAEDHPDRLASQTVLQQLYQAMAKG